VAERFDSPFSPHSVAAALKLFDVNQFFRFMHLGVFRASPFLVHFKSFFHVFCVSSVVAAVLTAKNVNIVGQSYPSRANKQLSVLS
jgi:hypothetical protein